jgi:hypothetical protein
MTLVRPRKQGLICALMASVAVVLPGLVVVGSASAQTFPTTACNYSWFIPREKKYSAILQMCTLTWYNRSVRVAGTARDILTTPMNLCFIGTAPGAPNGNADPMVCRWLKPGVYRSFGFTLDASTLRGGIRDVTADLVTARDGQYPVDFVRP